MRYSTKLSVAIHILLGIDYFSSSRTVTSDFLADSIGIVPSAVRKTFTQLKSAGLISVKIGTGGAALLKMPEDISLYDIYKAVETCDEPFLHIHEKANRNCPVGRYANEVIKTEYDAVQLAAEDEMRRIHLSDFTDHLQSLIDQE